MSHKEYDYVVVGAGLAGSTISRVLKDHGKRVLVLEKNQHVAGNCYSEKVDGIEVHKYGAHIFRTSDKYMWEFVNRFSWFVPYQHNVMFRHKDHVYNMPFNLNMFCKIWPNLSRPEEIDLQIKEEIEEAGITDPKNLEEKAISLVGKTVYDIFIRDYTAKQWKKDPKDLPASLIRRLPLRFTFNNNYFNDIWQGIPDKGYTSFIENMLEGIDLKLNFDFNQHKEDFKESIVIYTGSVDEYYDDCFGELPYKSCRFEEVVVHTDNFQGCSVMNIGDVRVPWTRSIEHKHFDRFCENKTTTIVSYEYPDIYKKGGDLMRMYALEDKNSQDLYSKYKELADKEEKVIFAGRLGQYKYFGMEEVIKDSFEKAWKILGVEKC